MLNAIAKPFGALMLWLYNLVGNYGLAVILFALIVKLIMLPFQLKSKKSMMRMSRMTPRLKELEKKFGNDQQRYQQEMSKLYKEEGINPMSGCFWSLLPFPILIALYQAIRYPITIMMGVSADLIASGGAIYEKMVELGFDVTQYASGRAAAYSQIYYSQFITNASNWPLFQGLSDKLVQLDYSFLGLDLGSVPTLPWNWTAFNWATVGLFLIPLVSAGLSWLSMKIANATNVQTQANQQSNRTMMLFMPLMSLWICFSMPGVMGIYWIAQSVFAIIQDVILTRVFNRQLDVEDADRIAREKAREAEIEAKHQTSLRLKAEGITVENKNTSKKNKKAVAAQKEAERKAAEARAEKARKRAARGEKDDIPASQVGNRRYARGRAYVPDRFSNPDEAEEKTLAAAEESDQYAKEHPELEPQVETDETVELEAEELNEEAEDISEEDEASEETEEASEETEEADEASKETEEAPEEDDEASDEEEEPSEETEEPSEE